MKEGCDYCFDHGFSSLILEMDSLALMKIVTREWECPWKIVMLIKRIRNYMKGGQLQITHTLREGNALADFLTNKCFSFAGTQAYKSFAELPQEAKGIAILDKQQVPQLRIKRMKKKATD